jgi:hypothetical protein
MAAALRAASSRGAAGEAAGAEGASLEPAGAGSFGTLVFAARGAASSARVPIRHDIEARKEQIVLFITYLQIMIVMDSTDFRPSGPIPEVNGKQRR